MIEDGDIFKIESPKDCIIKDRLYTAMFTSNQFGRSEFISYDGGLNHCKCEFCKNRNSIFFIEGVQQCSIHNKYVILYKKRLQYERDIKFNQIL